MCSLLYNKSQFYLASRIHREGSSVWCSTTAPSAVGYTCTFHLRKLSRNRLGKHAKVGEFENVIPVDTPISRTAMAGRLSGQCSQHLCPPGHRGGHQGPVRVPVARGRGGQEAVLPHVRGEGWQLGPPPGRGPRGVCGGTPPAHQEVCCLQRRQSRVSLRGWDS